MRLHKSAKRIIRRHVTMATPPSGLVEQFSGVMSRLSLGTRKMPAKFEVCSINRLENMSTGLNRSAERRHTHADTHTSNENIISTIHSVHSAEIKIADINTNIVKNVTY